MEGVRSSVGFQQSLKLDLIGLHQYDCRITKAGAEQ